jgi:hypothetical protein
MQPTYKDAYGCGLPFGSHVLYVLQRYWPSYSRLCREAMIHLVDLSRKAGLWSFCSKLLDTNWSTQIERVTCKKCVAEYKRLIVIYDY